MENDQHRRHDDDDILRIRSDEGNFRRLKANYPLPVRLSPGLVSVGGSRSNNLGSFWQESRCRTSKSQW